MLRLEKKKKLSGYREASNQNPNVGGKVQNPHFLIKKLPAGAGGELVSLPPGVGESAVSFPTHQSHCSHDTRPSGCNQSCRAEPTRCPARKAHAMSIQVTQNGHLACLYSAPIATFIISLRLTQMAIRIRKSKLFSSDFFFRNLNSNFPIQVQT